MQNNYSYLALGDSYTIGESVLLTQSYPYQAVQGLREAGHAFGAPEIIAKTGWTTDELDAGMKGYRFLNKYDFVTLLIGVNNQYRGHDVMAYKMEFEQLLQRALALAGDRKSRVAVLSIPDYSATPFTVQMDREKIRREVDIFNNINHALSIQYKVNYIDITPGSRDAEADGALVAGDGLHPSGKEYRKWAQQLADVFLQQLK